MKERTKNILGYTLLTLFIIIGTFLNPLTWISLFIIGIILFILYGISKFTFWVLVILIILNIMGAIALCKEDI